MRIRYGWELALAALLVIEIVAFGAINPRMLDLNMLLFSTSDFICIGIVALPYAWHAVSVCRKRSAAFRYGRSDGVRRYWWIPDGVYRFR